MKYVFRSIDVSIIIIITIHNDNDVFLIEDDKKELKELIKSDHEKINSKFKQNPNELFYLFNVKYYKFSELICYLELSSDDDFYLILNSDSLKLKIRHIRNKYLAVKILFDKYF